MHIERRIAAFLSLLIACNLEQDDLDFKKPTSTTTHHAFVPSELRMLHPKQGYTAAFHTEGVHFRAAVGELMVTTKRWGREGALADALRVVPVATSCSEPRRTSGRCLQRVEYRSGVLREWWESTPRGMEQGFTLEPPLGDGLLWVELDFGTSNLEVDHNEVRILGNGQVLRYSNLRAWDSLGTELPSWMEAIPSGVRLVVDDTGAIGEITIDPLFSDEQLIPSDQTSSYFGRIVSNAGDVNGDGYDDALVGADYYNSVRGRAYLYYGSATGLNPNTFWYNDGPNQYSYYGYAVAGSDINGDGYSDVLIGASNESTVDIFYGSPLGISAAPDEMLSNPDLGGIGGWNFGAHIASVGDLNEDGYGDVLVGSPIYSDEFNYQGKVYLFFGSASGLNPIPEWSVIGSMENQSFGLNAQLIGDTDGDGYPDIAVASPGYENPDSYEGSVDVYVGSATGWFETVPSWHFEGNMVQAGLGELVGAGDVNADGFADLLIGISSTQNSTQLFLGSANGLSTTPAWSVQAIQHPYWGWGMEALGDVNDDGFDDVMVANQWAGPQGGETHIFLGNATGLETTSVWTQNAGQELSQHGASIDTGDFNGDGLQDILVGTPQYDPGIGYAGAIQVYFGCSDVVYPDGDGDRFGDTSGAISVCALPNGYVPVGGDCDDALDGVFPGAVEVPDDLVDQDCDGSDATTSEDTGGETGETVSSEDTGEETSGEDTGETGAEDTSGETDETDSNEETDGEETGDAETGSNEETGGEETSSNEETASNEETGSSEDTNSDEENESGGGGKVSCGGCRTTGLGGGWLLGLPVAFVFRRRMTLR